MDIHVRAYCQCNLGDDLFVIHLAKKYPQHTFYVYALAPNDAAFRDIPNIRLPSFADRVSRKLIHMLSIPGKVKFDGQGVDLSVTVGGSILWENADLSFGMDGVDSYLIGPNCDSGYSDGFQERLGQALSKVCQCSFRDTYSYNLFRDLPNVSYAPDVLFDYEPAVTPIPGVGIGISVISPGRKMASEQMGESYYAALARVCDLCFEREIPVRLLGFCRAEGDEDAIQEILKRVSHPEYPKTYTYCGDVLAMMRQLNACSTILASRFHAMILGWILRKNILPVIYSEKQTHVLEDMDFRGDLWKLAAGESIIGEALLEAALSENGRMNIFKMKEKSKAHFAALDQIL